MMESGVVCQSKNWPRLYQTADEWPNQTLIEDSLEEPSLFVPGVSWNVLVFVIRGLPQTRRGKIKFGNVIIPVESDDYNSGKCS